MGSIDVWLNTLAIANILSFIQLEKQYRITYDTKGTNGKFIVHTPSGEVHFKQNKIKLAYISLTKSKVVM